MRIMKSENQKSELKFENWIGGIENDEADVETACGNGYGWRNAHLLLLGNG